MCWRHSLDTLTRTRGHAAGLFPLFACLRFDGTIEWKWARVVVRGGGAYARDSLSKWAESRRGADASDMIEVGLSSYVITRAVISGVTSHDEFSGRRSRSGEEQRSSAIGSTSGSASASAVLGTAATCQRRRSVEPRRWDEQRCDWDSGAPRR